MISYNIISTGSQGNAVVIGGIVLVDCGVPFSALRGVYRDIKIVLLTHIHSDHFKPSTIKKLADERPTLRFACCKWLVNDLLNSGVQPTNIDVLTIYVVENAIEQTLYSIIKESVTQTGKYPDWFIEWQNTVYFKSHIEE